MPYRQTMEFMLFDWLQVDRLFGRPRFCDHDTETLRAVFDTCERVAAEHFAPNNRVADLDEPKFDGEKVVLPRCAYEAHDAYVGTGMLAAGQDYDVGGMQLPYCAELAANGFFIKGSVGLWGGALLTVGNANLLLAHGTALQRDVFAANEFAGRFSGTMCLSEPHAGSSLSDITTKAAPDGDDHAADPLGARYRIRGNKMWISCADHELSENIVHLVLAKIPGEDGRMVPGTKGISLFVVPKFLVFADGILTGERNDVAIAGLNHKMGYRGAPNAALNFGEGKYPVRGGPGALGYLVGEVGKGLQYMFHMMNEARIGVGFIATMLGQAGLKESVEYARTRKQGRAPGKKDPTSPQIPIIEHADVRRMLLSQKAWSDGALALCLYGARLVDERNSGDERTAREAKTLLDLLTPVIKSWPSEWALASNNLAIQVLGGAGYTRDFQVEQHWRDNRLNMIHEGTNSIQALDLLGRKVGAEGGRGLELLRDRVRATVGRALASPRLSSYAHRLDEVFVGLAETTSVSAGGDLANAAFYLNAFGHATVAWVWLDIMCVLGERENLEADHRCSGLWASARYFLDIELPNAVLWLAVVRDHSTITAAIDPEWF